jgi:peptidyl-prolyl cis-trans isomerase C
MFRLARTWLPPLAVGLAVLPALAQTAPPAQPTQPAAPIAAPAAATVNGYVIPETAVQRALERLPPARRAEARPELINYLIDNVLVEQHLVQQGVKVEPAEVDKRIEEMKSELAKQNRDLMKMLQEMKVSVPELREQTAADLRWDRYASSQATDSALKQMFETDKVMFDGTTVRARHILLTPPAGDAAAAQKVQGDLVKIKQDIEAKVNAELAKQPADAEPLAREKARIALIDDAFAEKAREISVCPGSKNQGGDVGWFQRAGFMVEPFARTAFALKTYQISDVVQTQFGYHLILVTDRKPGMDIKFDDVKDDVREAFCERLRESILAQIKSRSQIVITPVK